MATSDRPYRIRYTVEPWGKPTELPKERVAPGIARSGGKYGYADDVFVASILRDEKGGIASILLMSSEPGPGRPSRELLEAVRDQIIHQLECHTPK